MILSERGIIVNEAEGVGEDEIIVPNLAALAALPASLPNGVTATVLTLQDDFMLDTASTLTPDGITVIAALAGGNWLRVGLTSLTWTQQTTWYIALAGNDENDGLTLLTALATPAEYVRRTGTSTPTSTVNVFIADSPVGDVVHKRGTGTGAFVWFHGTPVLIANTSGTIAGTVTEDPATSTPYSLTANGIANSWTNLGAVGWLLIADGDYSTWLDKDSNPAGDGTESIRTCPWDNGGGFSAPPANGTAFGVYQLTTTLTFYADADSSDYELDYFVLNTFLPVSANENGKFFYRSKFSVNAGTCFAQACSINIGNLPAATKVDVFCSLVTGVADVFNGALTVQDCLCTGQILVQRNGTVLMTQVGMFDAPGDAITISSGGVVAVVTGHLYGSGGAGVPVVVRSTGEVTYDNVPTITGSNPGVNDFTIGGVNHPWADAPIVDLPTLSCIVVG